MNAKSFPVPVIVSATHRHLLCDSGFSSVHELIEWVCGEPVWTHQIPRVFESVRDGVFRQHPQLRIFSSGGCDETNWQKYRDEAIRLFGESLKIEHGSAAGYEPIHPLDEPILAGKEVVAIQPPDFDTATDAGGGGE